MRYGDAVVRTIYNTIFGRKEQASMGLHIELNSWAQAEEHFRDVDQDQGREHYDRDMFNCELALNIIRNRYTV
jgi:hypothetical protein